MTFRGAKQHPQLAQAASDVVGFPENEVAHDFSGGFVREYLTRLPGDVEAYSATFLAQQATNDVYALAMASGDPFRIDQHPHLGTLQVDIEMNDSIQGKTLFLFLSIDPLTDPNGLMLLDPFDTVLHFPELSTGESEFLFTYLHPGSYHVTVIADANEDGFPGEGDITHVSQAIQVGSEQNQQIQLRDIHIQN